MNLYAIYYDVYDDKVWTKSREYSVSDHSIAEGTCRVTGTGLHTSLCAEFWTMESGKEAEEKIYKKLVEALVNAPDRSIATREAHIETLKSERKELIEAFGGAYES